MRPPCFPATGLLTWYRPSLFRVPASQVPRIHRYYGDTTTSHLHLAAYGFAVQVHVLLAASCSIARSLERRARSRAWGFISGRPRPACHVVDGGISQVPG